MDPWRISSTGISIALRVTPRGGRDAIDGIEQLSDGRSVLKLRVRAVAVANAHPEVLAAVDEVTASNDDDGVALVLERWFGVP